MTAELRSEIDQIDRAISQLLKQRASISAQIQQARVSSGGARVDLAREREVMNAYIAALGPHGSDVANTVLTLCRGAISDAVRSERAGQPLPQDGDSR